jgi:hypothetical protein
MVPTIPVGPIKARSSVEIENSCNCCLPFFRKKHKHVHARPTFEIATSGKEIVRPSSPDISEHELNEKIRRAVKEVLQEERSSTPSN